MSAKPSAPRNLISLEQFSALEAWVEAASKLAGLQVGKPGVSHAAVITEVYKKRMRAMQMLTGAKPPATASDDEDPYGIG